MAGFNQNLILSMMLVAIVFIGVSTIIFSSVAIYDVNDEDEYYGNIFDTYDDSLTSYEDTNEIIQGGDINVEGFDEAVYSNTIVAGKQSSREYFKLFRGFVSDSGKLFGIDPKIIGLLIAIVGVLSMFGFLAMITKVKP